MRNPSILAIVGLISAEQASAKPVVHNDHADVYLISEVAHPTAGKTITVGIRIAPKAGWHSYWSNPGDAGAPNRFTWTLPKGVIAGTPRYPTPQALLAHDMMSHVYNGPTTLLVQIDVPSSVRGKLPIALRLDYLLCSTNLCSPQHAELTMSLSLGNGARDPASAQTFAAAREAMPVPLEGVRFISNEGRLTIIAPLTVAAAGAHFFAAADGTQSYSGAQTVRREGKTLIVETASAQSAPPPRLAGVLRVDGPDGPRGYTIDAAPWRISDRIGALEGRGGEDLVVVNGIAARTKQRSER